jgi:diguanylate cyclase (GGDEF)-like protein
MADSLYASALDHDNSNRELAIEQAKKALDLAEKSDYPAGMLSSLLYLGEVYSILRQDAVSRKYFQQLYDLALIVKDSVNMAYSYYSLGKIKYRDGDLGEALKYFLASLEISEKMKNNYFISKTALRIGDIYNQVGQFVKAKEYYRHALEKEITQNDKDGIAKTYIKLGNNYVDVEDSRKAISYYRKALELHKEMDNPKGIANASNRMANGLLLQKKYSRALSFAEKALSEAGKFDNPDLMADIYLTLGNVYFHSGKINLALKYAHEALNKVVDSKLKNKIYKILLDIYSFLDVDYEVLKYYKLYTSSSRNLLIPQTISHISKLQERYDKEKEEKEMELRRRKEEIIRLRKRNVIWTGIFLLLLIISLALLYIGKAKYAKKLHLLATTDSLTGLLNRRSMEEQMKNELNRFRRNKIPFSILMGDIDHFKKINDTYGHDFGDYVLKGVAEILRMHTRGQDVICRWGGEEFLLMLPETNLNGAANLAEKIRVIVEKKSFEFHNMKTNLTLTFGVCEYDSGSSIEQCINIADKALYAGKIQGRNQVVLREMP